MPFRPDVSDGALDAIAEAIRVAKCPDREGPFGLHEYSGCGDQGDHRANRVRDFRSLADPSYGSSVHVCDDPEEARRVYEEMTRRHVAAAAWDAVVELMASEAKVVGA